MKKITKIIILFVFLISCNNNLDYNIDKNRPSNMRTEYHDSLKKCIIKYIRTVDGQFLNKRWLYYSVFFHDVAIREGILNCDVPENETMMKSTHIRLPIDRTVSAAIYEFNQKEEEAGS